MFELICLLLALVWLYFWLSGHWFARVIAFLAMLGAASVAGFVVFLTMPSMPDRTDPWSKYQPSNTSTNLHTLSKDGASIVARLPDGTELEFPDGTADNVIDKTVSNYMALYNPRGEKPKAWETAPIVVPASRWAGTELRSSSGWMKYGGLALAGLLALLSWRLASIPIAYHRRARSRQTTMATRTI
jgi:hypothetical protein